MKTHIIQVRGLSKQYRIGTRDPYGTLRDTLATAVRAPMRKLLRNGTPSERIWALRDVSFDVRPGETVGIIGRNGAGKSTLLKILSRVTEPTSGLVQLYGRVASLLEVGTGFHWELTGRENIFLNGSILGMKRAEIKRRFDAIVAFAEIEKFLDTPVKRYSSGMYLRLAFAVAAHLEPEILMVDEVLAVGDANFQRKCLSKMEDVGRQGRTVLFVSHNMPAVTRLCPRTILLDAGKVISDGRSTEVVSSYLTSGLGTTAVREWDPSIAPGDEIVRLRAVRIRNSNGVLSDALDIRQPIGVELEYEVIQPGHVLVPNYHFHNDEGVQAFVARETDPEWDGRIRPVGRYASLGWIPGNFLSEGTFFVSVAISTMNPMAVHFFERDAVAFQVVDSMDGNSARGDYAGPMPGVVRPILRWQTLPLSESRELADAIVGETSG